MNSIEKLINELCPNGVEFKPLGEVTIRNAFKQLGANELEKLKSDSNKSQIKLLPSSKNDDWWGDDEKCSKYVCNGEIITLGRARYANLKYHNGKFISSNNVIIQSKDEKRLNGRFLYFFYCFKFSKFLC